MATATDTAGYDVGKVTYVGGCHTAHGLLDSQRVEGIKRLIFMNPPFELMRSVIALVAYYKLDVILVYPKWPRAWITDIRAARPVADGPVRLDAKGALCIPGERVVRKDQGRIRYPLLGVLVVWP